MRPTVYLANGGTFTIDPTVAVGATLAELEIYGMYRVNPELIICSSALGRHISNHSGAPLGNHTYATNIPGIGWHYPPAFESSASTYFRYYNFERNTVKLVKTGPITANGTLRISGLTYSFDAPDHRIAMNTGTLPAFNLVIPARPTCRLSNPNIHHNFGVISLPSATDPILSSGNFFLQIACSGGAGGRAPNLYVSFTDANRPGNRSQNLTILPEDSGMTLGLSRGAGWINFAPASPGGGHPEELFIREMSDPLNLVTINAVLMRAGPMRSLASFSAQATMTLRYE